VNVKALALSIVDDLRRRRLLPVAALLLVVVLVLPFVALKSSSTPVAAPTPAATNASTQSVNGLPSPAQALSNADKPLVSLAVLDQASDLGEFESKNPFKPLQKVSASGTTGGSSSGSSSSGSTSSGGSSGGGSSSGGSTTGGSTGGGSTGGGTGGGDTGGGTGGGQTPQTNGGGGTGKTTKLTYALDATLAGPTKTVHYKSLPKLQALPGSDNPLFIFLGVDSTGDKAVFLIDSSLTATAGEGTCSPSTDSCGTLKLEPGQVEVFQTAAGKRYSLQIDQIREVSVASAASAARKKEEQAKDQAHSSVGPTRRFVPPVITDLLTTKEL
jgi:hypothetical protein